MAQSSGPDYNENWICIKAHQDEGRLNISAFIYKSSFFMDLFQAGAIKFLVF